MNSIVVPQNNHNHDGHAPPCQNIDVPIGSNHVFQGETFNNSSIYLNESLTFKTVWIFSLIYYSKYASNNAMTTENDYKSEYGAHLGHFGGEF